MQIHSFITAVCMSICILCTCIRVFSELYSAKKAFNPKFSLQKYTYIYNMYIFRLSLGSLLNVVNMRNQKHKINKSVQFKYVHIRTSSQRNSFKIIIKLITLKFIEYRPNLPANYETPNKYLNNKYI